MCEVQTFRGGSNSFCNSHFAFQEICNERSQSDMVHEYERAMGRQLRSQPSWAAARDPLHGQPQRQSQRSAAVLAVWGAMPDVWRDVLHNLGRARFIPGFRVFLQFT
jgi:hypothetical protein